MAAPPQEWLAPPNVINATRELSFDLNKGDLLEAIDVYQAAFGGEVVGSYGHKSDFDPAQLGLTNISGNQDLKFTEELHGIGYKAPANNWVLLEVPDVTKAIDTIMNNCGRENEIREIEGNVVAGRVKDRYDFGWILTPSAN